MEDDRSKKKQKKIKIKKQKKSKKSDGTTSDTVIPADDNSLKTDSNLTTKKEDIAAEESSIVSHEQHDNGLAVAGSSKAADHDNGPGATGIVAHQDNGLRGLDKVADGGLEVTEALSGDVAAADVVTINRDDHCPASVDEDNPSGKLSSESEQANGCEITDVVKIQKNGNVREDNLRETIDAVRETEEPQISSNHSCYTACPELVESNATLYQSCKSGSSVSDSITVVDSGDVYSLSSEHYYSLPSSHNEMDNEYKSFEDLSKDGTVVENISDGHTSDEHTADGHTSDEHTADGHTSDEHTVVADAFATSLPESCLNESMNTPTMSCDETVVERKSSLDKNASLHNGGDGDHAAKTPAVIGVYTDVPKISTQTNHNDDSTEHTPLLLTKQQQNNDVLIVQQAPYCPCCASCVIV